MAPLPGLLRWLEEPGVSAVSFALGPAGSREWIRCTQESLARGVRAAASLMSSSGVVPGATVVIALGTGPGFVHAYFGALGCDAVPTAIEPPGPLTKQGSYVERLAALLRGVRPAVTVGDARFAALLDMCPLDSPPPQVLSPSALLLGDDSHRLSFTAHSLVGQLTSGTTGSPKIVRLTAEQVSDHVMAIWKWLTMNHDDVGVSWLPLHHDMGLVGHLLLPLARDIDEYLIPPLRFIRSPATWMAALSERRGTITASPTFGYRYLLDRVDRVDGVELENLDLSPCRVAVVGAEPVDAKVLRRFLARFSSAGLRPSVLRPAYGLAEATLAVTGRPSADGITVVRPGDIGGGLGTRVEIIEHGPLSSVPLHPPVIVSCGRALPGTIVVVVDDEGDELPEGTLGEIAVGATWTNREGEGQLTDPACLPLLITGDAGFLLNDELYVLGRLGDSLQVRGKRVFATSIEADLVAETGVPAVVVMGDEPSGQTVLSLVESRVGRSVVQHIHAVVRRQVDARSVVVQLSRGAVPKTTSGKPRRRSIWAAYLAGTYTVRVVGVDRGCGTNSVASASGL